MTNRLKEVMHRVAYHFPLIETIYQKYTVRKFRGSQAYWAGRYEKGGNSGAGSYGNLANFKAEFLNAFVQDHQVQSVLEFGCGDGNQATLAKYPSYIGLDVSRAAVKMCAERFRGDKSKSFFLYDSDAFSDNGHIFFTDLAMSLDVIYHLVEDAVYDRYLTHLFRAADRFVIIYSSNDDNDKTVGHIRHRRFTDWVAKNATSWTLKSKCDNPFPHDPLRPGETSFADFYVFEKLPQHSDVRNPELQNAVA